MCVGHACVELEARARRKAVPSADVFRRGEKRLERAADAKRTGTAGGRHHKLTKKEGEGGAGKARAQVASGERGEKQRQWTEKGQERAGAEESADTVVEGGERERVQKQIGAAKGRAEGEVE